MDGWTIAKRPSVEKKLGGDLSDYLSSADYRGCNAFKFWGNTLFFKEGEEVIEINPVTDNGLLGKVSFKSKVRQELLVAVWQQYVTHPPFVAHKCSRI